MEVSHPVATMVYLGYWFMLPISVCVATAAMTFGVGGAVLFSPLFIIMFPVLGVPTLTPGSAFGAALLTELVGFSSGLAGYQVRSTLAAAQASECTPICTLTVRVCVLRFTELIDFHTGLELCAIGVPMAVLGTGAKHFVSGPILIVLFSVGMFLLAMSVAHSALPSVVILYYTKLVSTALAVLGMFGQVRPPSPRAKGGRWRH